MNIFTKILFIALTFSANICFGDDSIEFRLAYKTDRPDTTKIADMYNRIIFVENQPSLIISDLSQIKVVVKEEEPPPWLKSLEREPDTSFKIIRTKEIILHVFFNETGKRKFTKITSENIGEILVIYLNNQIAMAPTIQEAIDIGETYITTEYTEKEAIEFANTVNSIIKVD